MAHSLYLPYVEIRILYACVCVCLYVCLYVYLSVQCPPYQAKLLVCVHTWPIKLILILVVFLIHSLSGPTHWADTGVSV